MNLRDAGVVLHERVRLVLERLSRSRTEEPRLVERAAIVLNGVEGMSHVDQAEQLGVDRQRVRRWTVRWIGANGRLTIAATDPRTKDRDVEKLVFAVLSDEYRSGTPPVAHDHDHDHDHDHAGALGNGRGPWPPGPCRRDPWPCRPHGASAVLRQPA